MEALKAHLLALLTAIVGIVVGFGVVDNGTAAEIISAGGILLGAIFSIANVFHVKFGKEEAVAAASKPLVGRIQAAPALPSVIRVEQVPPGSSDIPASALTAEDVSLIQHLKPTEAGPQFSDSDAAKLKAFASTLAGAPATPSNAGAVATA